MIAKNSYLTVVGSIAYDDVITSEGAKDNLFGGSATYFSISASNFSNVSIVGTVGKDFRESDINLLKSKIIDTSNIKKIIQEILSDGRVIINQILKNQKPYIQA